jgi:SAM-dependent methyltransferase
MNVRQSLRNLVAEADPEHIKRGWASDHAHPEPWNWDYLCLRAMQQQIAAEPPPRARVILDVGVGPRPYHALISASDHYIGLDIDRQPGVTLLGDGHCLPLRAASVDLVVSFQVLEHVARPEIVVEEMLRVLRPGGRLLVSIPGNWPFHGHDYWRWTHEGIERLFGQFADVAITPVNGPVCLSAMLLAYVTRDMAARLSNKSARIAGRLTVAGATTAMNGAVLAIEGALRRTRTYEQLRYDCTDGYFVRAVKPA